MSHFEFVKEDFSFTQYNNLSDIPEGDGARCIVKMIRGYHCATYSHYEAEVVDKDGNPSAVNYLGYSFSSFKISGPASNHCLILEYKNTKGEKKERTFRSDISFNHSGEGYSRIKDEWSRSTQYKDIFEFFDYLTKYGEDAYEIILKYEREAFENDAAYRQERDQYDSYRKSEADYKECVRELYFPDTWTSIPYNFGYSDNLERIFIPASINYIPRIPHLSRLKMIICLAENPPRIGDTRWLSDHGVHLYVPQSSVQIYKDDKDWSSAFLVINGI